VRGRAGQEGGDVVIAEPVAEAWAPACMAPDEWADWQRLNPSPAPSRRGLRGSLFVDRPCADCPIGYAVDMRALGRCNGKPGGTEEDTEMDQPEPTAPRGLTTTRRVSLEVIAPPCGSCSHEPVCALRAAFEGMATVETNAPSLPAGLRLYLTATVECGHYLRDEAKPAPVRVLTPQERGQANGADPFRRAARRISDETRQKMRDSAIRAWARKTEGAAAG
jgi:hypothetical protein